MIGKIEEEKMQADFLTLLDITSRSKATDKDIEELSEEINRKWWQENKESFLGESSN
jgi:hypothetical protein